MKLNARIEMYKHNQAPFVSLQGKEPERRRSDALGKGKKEKKRSY